jgi:hypothetical protein
MIDPVALSMQRAGRQTPSAKKENGAGPKSRAAV